MKFWARVILPFYLVVLAWIVFAPEEDAGHVTRVVAWAATVLSGFDVPVEEAYVVLGFLANIALFVPFGALLTLAFARLSWWAIVALGSSASVSIELIQLALPSRYSTLSDAVANSLGAGVGVLLLTAALVRTARSGTENS